MIVNEEGRSITLKKEERLALVRPTFDESGALIISVPNRKPIRLVLRKSGETVVVSHFSNKYEAIDQGDEVANFFGEFLGMKGVRLVRMRDEFVKSIESRHAKPGLYQNSFSDAWPLLLTSEASLKDISGKVGRDLKMNRFRPNITVMDIEGALKPFQEDAWKCLSIGETSEFEILKNCIRCRVVTIDPRTGVLDKENQPTVALKQFRSFGKKVAFGRYMAPKENNGKYGVIKVGDAVTINQVLSEVPVPDCQ